mmetsp:Transcript_7572/g.23391  ORF Transcript_7572/g.23391 Transcript_7572/m.23391 type:complete len:269 (-) Transcript_7572:102-908(-)
MPRSMRSTRATPECSAATPPRSGRASSTWTTRRRETPSSIATSASPFARSSTSPSSASTPPTATPSCASAAAWKSATASKLRLTTQGVRCWRSPSTTPLGRRPAPPRAATTKSPSSRPAWTPRTCGGSSSSASSASSPWPSSSRSKRSTSSGGAAPTKKSKPQNPTPGNTTTTTTSPCPTPTTTTTTDPGPWWLRCHNHHHDRRKPRSLVVPTTMAARARPSRKRTMDLLPPLCPAGRRLLLFPSAASCPPFLAVFFPRSREELPPAS